MTKADVLCSALQKLQSTFVARMEWSKSATEDEKSLVIGNLNGFCAFLAEQMPAEIEKGLHG